jgi:hypothetical protein
MGQANYTTGTNSGEAHAVSWGLQYNVSYYLLMGATEHGNGIPSIGISKFIGTPSGMQVDSINWTGLDAITRSIECTESFIVPITREGDGYIMDAICDCKWFHNKSQIQQINACRLYLQVLLLSDIATPCGQFTFQPYYKGSRDQPQNWPSIRYPKQANPNAASW